MKKHFFIIPTLLIVFTLLNSKAFSQDVWEDPQAITDSISDNTNPLLVHSGNTTLIFYEKTREDGFISIFMQDMSELHHEIELFSEENIHFRNPQAIVFRDWPNPPDTLFYLFFESDMESSGFYNIYYTKYSQDGHFTEPEALDISYTSCEHLRACNNNLVWERGGNIEYCFLENDDHFSPIQTLDVGDCMNPEVGNKSIVYQKQINDSLKVIFADYSSETQDWKDPEIIYEHSTLGSIVVLNSDMEESGDYGVIWESFLDGNYQLLTYDYSWDALDTLDYTSQIPIQLTALAYDIILKQNKSPWVTNIAIVKQQNGNKEIYVNEGWGGIGNLTNISNSIYEESNPALYYFTKGLLSTVVLFWQSTRNNHEQLFITKRTYLYEGINSLKRDKISIYPNPASSKISIQLGHDIHQNIKIDILDLNGKILSELFDGDIAENTRIDLNLPAQLTNGTYILRINSRDRTDFEKLLISK